MDDRTRGWRELDALENIATELLRLRVLKEHELGEELEHNSDGQPYVPRPYVFAPAN
jgi:hypothetical protein